MHYASPVKDIEHLARLVISEFLRDDLKGARFVAWNGNRFDAYFIAAALLTTNDYIIYPYLTRSKALRGMRVIRKQDEGDKKAPQWEFLDGIAMLGLVGVKLAKLVATFAPEFPKLIDAIDFEREEFDSGNAEHRAYAMRDSEGLYHAMTNAQNILLETFGQSLAVTMGAACIRIFTAHIPESTVVDALTPNLESIVLSHVVRGGYCHFVKRYEGPIYKYDINQAYASAMRVADLPAGGAFHAQGRPTNANRCLIVRITAHKPGNKIPFYVRAFDGARIRSVFAYENIPETWITSIEYRQLLSEGWQVTAYEFHVWSDKFSMRDYVDKLERIRMNCEGGPSGSIGTMIKAVGNHSYGKTLETIEPVQYALALEQPKDFAPYYSDDEESNDPIENVWWRVDNERSAKAHHQPHIGAFITAHVRMEVRRAALLNPKAWLYADTDCVIFSQDVTHLMDIDPKRYGAWKIEEAGTIFRITAKKVYSEVGGKKRSAKGLNVGKLTEEDFAQWHAGDPPTQDQIQIQNFLAVMHGADMYRTHKRKGTRVFLDELEGAED